MEKLPKVPPEKMSNRLRKAEPLKMDLRVLISMPGAGIWARRRKIARIKRVKKSLRRSSGSLKRLRMVARIWVIIPILPDRRLF